MINQIWNEYGPLAVNRASGSPEAASARMQGGDTAQDSLHGGEAFALALKAAGDGLTRIDGLDGVEVSEWTGEDFPVTVMDTDAVDTFVASASVQYENPVDVGPLLSAPGFSYDPWANAPFFKKPTE